MIRSPGRQSTMVVSAAAASAGRTIARRESGVDARYRIVRVVALLAERAGADHERQERQDRRQEELLHERRRTHCASAVPSPASMTATSAESSGANASRSGAAAQQQAPQREAEERAVHLSGPVRGRGR